MTDTTGTQRKIARDIKKLNKQLSPRVDRACTIATTDRPISIMETPALWTAVMKAALAGQDDAGLLAAANDYRTSKGV